MTVPLRLAGPPDTQSSNRRKPHTGSSVKSGMRQNVAKKAKTHESLPAFGAVIPKNIRTIASMPNSATTTFSGQAAFKGAS